MSMEVAIKITAINQAMGALSDVTKQVETLQDTVEKTKSLSNRLNDLGNNLTSMGQGLTTSLTLPIVGAGAAILKVAGDFEYSMNRVGALTKATGEQFTQLEDLARELGATTQYSASEAADAMSFLAMAGFKANDILDSLPGVLQLAAAGQVDLARAADISSNILAGFGMEAREIARVNDVLAYTLSNQNVNLEQLAYTMKYAAPIASNLGFSLEELSAAAGILGGAGIQGEMAGTALRSSLTRLASADSIAPVRDALTRLNVTVRDSSGEMKTLAEIMGELKKAGADTTDLKDIFGMEALGAAVVLMKQGGEDIAEFTRQIEEESTGTAAFLAEATMEGLVGSTKELMSALEGLAISIAKSGFMDFAESVVIGLSRMVSGLSQLDPRILKTITIIAGIAAVVGPFLIALGTVIKLIAVAISGFASLSSAVAVINTAFVAIGTVIAAVGWPVIAIIAAIAGAAALIYIFWEPIKAFFSGLFERIKTGFQSLKEFIANTWTGISSAVTGAIQSIRARIQSVFAGIANFLEPIASAVYDFFIAYFDLVSAIAGLIIRVLSRITSFAQGVFSRFAVLVNQGFSSAVNFVRNGVIRIVGFVAGIVGPVVNYARAGFLAFATALNQGFSSAVNFVRNGVVRIVGFVADLRSRVGNLILSLPEMAFNAGVNFINRLVQGIASRIDSVTAKVRQVTQSIRNLLPGSDAKEGPLSDLMASGRALFETFANGINGGPLTSLLGNVLGQAGGIISNASTAFAGLSRAVNSGMSAALEIVKTKSAQIIAAIVAIATPIFNAMTTAMGRLLSAAQSGLNQAVSLMQRLGAQLVSTLLSFSDQFFDAGKRLMDRFNAGINASVSSSMALMSSAAQSSANLLPVPRPPSVGRGGWLPPPPPLPGGIGGPSGTSAPLPFAPSSGTIQINYSPTINNTGGGNDQNLMETLRQHSRELAQMVEDAVARRDRARYA